MDANDLAKMLQKKVEDAKKQKQGLTAPTTQPPTQPTTFPVQIPPNFQQIQIQQQLQQQQMQQQQMQQQQLLQQQQIQQQLAIQELLKKIENSFKTLPKKELEAIKDLAIRCQIKKEISPQTFNIEVKKIQEEYIKSIQQTRPQAPNQPVSQTQATPEKLPPQKLKELIVKYSHKETSKEEKEEILKKHPEVAQTIKKLLEQRKKEKESQESGQTAPNPQPQPVVTQPTSFLQPTQVQPKAPQVVQPKLQQPIPQVQPVPVINPQPVPQQSNSQNKPQIQPSKKQKIENLPSKEDKKKGRKSEKEPDIKDLSDVTKIAGVNLEQEGEYLDENEKDFEEVEFVPQQMFLNKGPLRNKIQLRASGLTVNEDVLELISQAVNERMFYIIEDLIKISKHRRNRTKSNINTKESQIFQEQIQIREQVKFTEKKDERVEKKKKVVEKKSLEKREEEESQIRTSSADLAIELALGGSVKKRKVSEIQNPEEKKRVQVSTPQQSTITYEDIVFHLEKPVQTKKSKLLHQIYLRKK